MGQNRVNSVNERSNEMDTSASGQTVTTHGQATETSTDETSTSTILSRCGHSETKPVRLTTSKRMYLMMSSRSVASITLGGSRFHHYSLMFDIHSQNHVSTLPDHWSTSAVDLWQICI
jgi:hypothetical protein